MPLVTAIWSHTNRGQDLAFDDIDEWGWDTHNDIFFGLKERLLPRFDQGFSALLDDRAESAGVKFADADLIGCPVRLTVSDRSLKAGGVEVKRRDAAEREVVAVEEVMDRVRRDADKRG